MNIRDAIALTVASFAIGATATALYLALTWAPSPTRTQSNPPPPTPTHDAAPDGNGVCTPGEADTGDTGPQEVC